MSSSDSWSDACHAAYQLRFGPAPAGADYDALGWEERSQHFGRMDAIMWEMDWGPRIAAFREATGLSMETALQYYTMREVFRLAAWADKLSVRPANPQD